ncbi:MAG: hypothetical protein ACRCYU_14000 [Nocardioides sp.]
MVRAQPVQPSSTGTGFELAARVGSADRGAGGASGPQRALADTDRGAGRSRRRLVVVLAVAAAVLVTGLAISRQAALPDFGAVAVDVGFPASAERSGGAGGPTAHPSKVGPSASTATSPRPKPAESVSVRGFRCWDGSTVAAVTKCGDPVGKQGMSWVFPSLNTKRCTSISVPDRRQAWRCPMTVPGGSKAEVVYTELSSVQWGFRHFSRRYAGKVLGDSGRARLVWAPRELDGKWTVSSMYVRRPWAVDISADSARAVEQALARVKFRAVVSLNGTPRSG